MFSLTEGGVHYFSENLNQSLSPNDHAQFTQFVHIPKILEKLQILTKKCSFYIGSYQKSFYCK